MTLAIILNAILGLVFVGTWAGAVWLTHRALARPSIADPVLAERREKAPERLPSAA